MDGTTKRQRGEWPRVLPVLKNSEEMDKGVAIFDVMVADCQRAGYDAGRIAVLVKAGLASLVLTTAGIEPRRDRTGIVNMALNDAIDECIGRMRQAMEAEGRAET